MEILEKAWMSRRRDFGEGTLDFLRDGVLFLERLVFAYFSLTACFYSVTHHSSGAGFS